LSLAQQITFFLSVSLMLLLPFALRGYGPNVIEDAGIVTWALPVIIDEESDLTKACSGAGETDKALASFVPDAIAVWQGAPETGLTTTRQSLGSAVDVTNVCDFLFDVSACPLGVGNPNGPGQPNGSNPIIFDEDGTITELFFGSKSRFQTLGFAGIIALNPTTLKATKGEGVINLTCIANCDTPVGCTSSFADNDVLAFVVHELGHFFGMNHTQVNVGQTDESARATMNAVFNPSSAATIETLERDDKVGIGTLYPQSPDILTNNFCTVTGTIKDENGDEFQCANVIVRNKDASKTLTDVISFVSGGDLPGGTSETGRGQYTIRGLTPANTYQLTVTPINTSGVLGLPSSGIIPCNGGLNPTAPTFDEQILAEDIVCQSAGSTLIVNSSSQALTVSSGQTLNISDVTVVNASGNISTGGGGSSSGGGSGGSSGGSSSSSGGCSLVRR